MKLLFFLSVGFLFSCQLDQGAQKPIDQDETVDLQEITVLLSKDEDSSFYNWLSDYDQSINYIDVYELSKVELSLQLAKTNGILIAGGNDVNACIYGKDSEVERCGKFDSRRDTLELYMIEYALSNQIPLLCVCRGEQIFNVSQGGTLIIDIPTDFGQNIDHSGKDKTLHMVHVKRNTLLYEITQVDSAMVNSFHHQAVDDLASNLIIGARASDGLTESIELKDKSEHPFVLGVQWHPELMDTVSALSNPIRKRFLEEVLYQVEHQD